MTSEMKWVPTRDGEIPPGRRPAEGGYEAGGKLYHALGDIGGADVPGKTGRHFVSWFWGSWFAVPRLIDCDWDFGRKVRIYPSMVASTFSGNTRPCKS
jgi:hypothetical protein